MYFGQTPTLVPYTGQAISAQQAPLTAEELARKAANDREWAAREAARVKEEAASRASYQMGRGVQFLMIPAGWFLGKALLGTIGGIVGAGLGGMLFVVGGIGRN